MGVKKQVNVDGETSLTFQIFTYLLWTCYTTTAVDLHIWQGSFLRVIYHIQAAIDGFSMQFSGIFKNRFKNSFIKTLPWAVSEALVLCITFL